MTEFLKGYAAGANDMEAGRLVTEVEKWRQYQHKAANEAWKWKARADAAEAKLAEVEKDYESAEAQLDRTETRLAEVEKERDELRGWRNRANDLEVSMARARELAEKASDENTEYHTMPEIAHILSGDEEPTTKGDA